MRLFKNNYTRDVSMGAFIATLAASAFLLLFHFKLENKLMSVIAEEAPNVFNQGTLLSLKIKEIVDDSVIIIGIVILFSIILVSLVQCQIGRNRDNLYKRATINPISGLFNKAKYYEDIVSLLASGDREYLLATIDIDGFKAVNDVFGFSRGTFILKKVAIMLKDHTKQNEECYHAGNDLFYLLLENSGETEARKRLQSMIDDITKVLVDIDDAEFTKGMDISLYNHAISFSCGAFIIDKPSIKEKLSCINTPLQETDYWDMAHSFTDNAKMARKQGKGIRKNSVHFFDMATKHQILTEKK